MGTGQPMAIVKEKFNVTGMSCAACQARVERAVSKVAGVKSAAVNLLKNSMVVDFDDGATSAGAICQAVAGAGYGASPQERGKGAEGSPAARSKEEEKSVKDLKRRLLLSILFCAALLYLAMAPAAGLPLPSYFKDPSHAPSLALTEWLLTVPVLALNFRFFASGFKALFRLAPNMDSLVALGSAAASCLALASFYLMLDAQASGDAAGAARFAGNLYFDSSAMILTLVSVGKFFEARSKAKTTGALERLASLAPKTARLEKDGKEAIVPASSLKPGDIVILKTGDSVPADGVILSGTGSADESAITGESVPADKKAGDELTGAALVESGFLRMRVVRTGEDTALSKIIALVDEATSTKAPVARLADKVSGVFVPAVIAIALFTSALWLFLGKGWEFSLMMGVSVLVISCPCSLGLATPTAIMVGTGKGAENGILFKSAESLEAAKSIDTVVLDKTGTITEGRPVVTDIVTLSDLTDEASLSLAASVEALSEHPLARAICALAKDSGVKLSPAVNFTQAPGAVCAEVLGRRVSIGNAAALPEAAQKAGGTLDKLSGAGKTALLACVDGKPFAVFGLFDAVKPDSAAAVAAMKALGCEVWMVTGDNERTAKAVAALAGISHVAASVRPEGKEEIVRSLMEKGRRVLMVGDGINDAPALSRATLGAAIGAGTDVAIDCADIVLMKSRLTDVVTALKLSRAVMKNIAENLFWAFAYNTLGIPVAAGAFYPLFGWTLSPMIGAAAMSMSSVCVVANALRLRRFEPGELPKASYGPIPVYRLKSQTVRSPSMKKLIHVEGMHCPHCANAVKKALLEVPGVTSAEVSLEKKTAEVTLEGAVSDASLSKAIEDADFKAAGIEDL